MKFTRYNKILNTYLMPEDYADQNPDLANVQWIATNKIHGANFSFYCDGESIRIAKRSSFCDENFFGCKQVVENYKNNVVQLTQSIKEKNKDVEYVIVCGELYGKGIQKELNYGEKDFMVFDIALVEKNGAINFMHKGEALMVAMGHGLKTVQVVAKGTLKEVLGVDPNNFKCDMTACGTTEGFVISPIEHLNDDCGNRIIFKWKTKAFSEKKDKKPKAPKELDKEIADAVSEVLQLVTKARLSNVVSHEGKTKISNFSKLLFSFSADVIEEWGKQEDFNKINLGKIKKVVTSSCAKLIKENPGICFEM